MAGLGGVIGIVLGYLGYQIGQRTDTASETGSLHAKTTALGEQVSASVFPWHLKTPTLSTGTLTSLATGTSQEVLRINGDRIILGGHILSSTIGAEYFSLNIKIDGTMVFTNSFDYLSSTTSYSSILGIPTAMRDNSNDPLQWKIELPNGLHFASSFVIEAYHGATGGTSIDLGVAIWHIPA